MEDVPAAISEYASRFHDPVALIGCRCTPLAMDCCEYDLMVFSSNEFPPRLDAAGQHTVEVFHSKGDLRRSIDFGGTQMLNPSQLKRGSVSSDELRTKSRKLLNAAGRNSLVKCLILRNKSVDSDKDPIASAAWLKAAAFCYLRGLLQVSGIRSMPAHELEQLRKLGENHKDGELEVAFDAIGLDYATRRSISRAKTAASELLAKSYDKGLVLQKAEGLQQRQKIADAYYYLGRVICGRIEADETELLRYPKVIQVALGISTDQTQIQKSRASLFRAASAVLKN